MRALIPFIKLFKHQLWVLLLGLLLAFLTVLASVGLLSLSGWFLSISAFVSASYALASAFNFFMPAAGVRFFSLVRILSRYGDRVVSHQATFKLLSHIRAWFYERLERFSPAQLMSHRSSDLLARLVGDVDTLENLYIRVIVPSVVCLLIILLVIVYFSFISWRIAGLSALFLLASALIAPLLMSMLSKRTSHDLAKQQAELKANVVDYLQGLAELKLYQQTDQYLTKLAEQDQRFIKSQQKFSLFSGISLAAMSILLGLTIIVVTWQSVGLVLHSQISGAFIALFALGLMGAFEAVMPLPVAYQFLGKVVTSAKRILQVIDQPISIKFTKLAQQELVNTDIEFENVGFSYPDREPVLQDFSLSIPTGSKLAIVGSTGCGKTTLTKLLVRSWDVNSGRVSLGGVGIKDFSEQQLRDLITLVEQKPHLFNTTIRANLMLADQQATEEALWASLEKVGLKSFVANLPKGLDTWVGEHGKSLSGGQQKRLSLARALLKQAPILIFDEPTEGLDKTNETLVIKMLNQLSAECTVIVITHKRTLAECMDKVVSL